MRAGRRLALPLLLLGGCAAIPEAAPVAAPTPVLPMPVNPVAPSAIAITGSLTQGGLATGIVAPGTRSILLDEQPVPIARDGRFLIGFGRDAPASAVLTIVTADGDTRQQRLTIAPRTWITQSLPSLPRGTVPTPAFLEKRRGELTQIEAARATVSDSQGWRQRFVWPATGRISGVFGSQRIYAGEPGAPHSGVDVARPTGATVVAPADGVVILAAATPFTLEGNLLMIDHGMGLNSAFLHLSRIDVRVGDHVRQGQPIGAVGATGRATGPHLHWGMKWQDVRIDPQLLAGPMP